MSDLPASSGGTGSKLPANGGGSDAERVLISFEGVSAEVDGQTSLDRVDLSIRSGEVCVAFGREGSGTSELLRLAVGVGRPAAGRLEVLGIEPTRAGRWALRRFRSRIGYVFRGAGLMNNLTLAENVELPLRYHTKMKREEISRRAQELLDLFEVGRERGRRPAGVDLLARRRACFARALSLDPDVLLIDHPLEGLDPISGAHFLALLCRLIRRPGRACLVATSEVASYVGLASRYVMMEEGRVGWQGDAAALATTDHAGVRRFLERAVSGPWPSS